MKYRMHIAGPDDVRDFDSQFDALLEANAINKVFLLQVEEHGIDATPLCVATVSALPERRLQARGRCLECGHLVFSGFGDRHPEGECS